MKGMRGIFAVATMQLLAGCVSVNSLQVEDVAPENTLQVQGKSYDEVWNAAVKEVRSRGDLLISSADKAAGVIRADKPGGTGIPFGVFALGGGNGYNVAVFISPAQPGAPSYTVKVVSMQKAGPFAYANYAPAILNGIKLDLGLI